MSKEWGCTLRWLCSSPGSTFVSPICSAIPCTWIQWTEAMHREQREEKERGHADRLPRGSSTFTSTCPSPTLCSSTQLSFPNATSSRALPVPRREWQAFRTTGWKLSSPTDEPFSLLLLWPVWKFTKLIAMLGHQKNKIRQETVRFFFPLGRPPVVFCVQCAVVLSCSPLRTPRSSSPGTPCVLGQSSLGLSAPCLKAELLAFVYTWNLSFSSGSVGAYKPFVSYRGSCAHCT